MNHSKILAVTILIALSTLHESQACRWRARRCFRRTCVPRQYVLPQQADSYFIVFVQEQGKNKVFDSLHDTRGEADARLCDLQKRQGIVATLQEFPRIPKKEKSDTETNAPGTGEDVAAQRTWTNRSGQKSAIAILVEIRGNTAYFKNRSGNLVTTPITNLSVADQAYAWRFASSARTRTASTFPTHSATR